MKSLLTRLPGFLARHWLRVAIVGAALFIAGQKQINLNVKLGGQAPAPANVDQSVFPGSDVPNPAPASAPSSLLSSIFGSAEPVAAAAPNPAPANERPRLTEPQRNDLLSTLNPFKRRPITAPPAAGLFQRLRAVDQQKAVAFIKRFSHVAQVEQDKFGIPASIVLAHGLLYSEAGTTNAATAHNDWFRLPCGAGHSGDFRMENGKCYRTYETAWFAFRGHSQLLTTGNFAPLRQLDNKDYKQWASALQRQNLHGSPTLATDLTQAIEYYQLYRFD